MANDTHNSTESDRTGADEAAPASEEAQYQAQPFIDLPSRWDRWEPLAEVVATFILALATVATAWSGYQSARWGRRTIHQIQPGRCAADRIRARLNQSRANRPGRYRLIHQLDQRLCRG